MKIKILAIKEAAELINVSTPFFNSNILRIEAGTLRQAKKEANKFFNQFNQTIDYLIFGNLLFTRNNKKSSIGWKAGKWN